MRWMIVAGDFVPTGGMDQANLALASQLASDGCEVHVVAHRVTPHLARRPGVHVHPAPRPLGSHLLGAPLLDATGRRWAMRLQPRETRVVVNGGNCMWGDVNWVHYVHGAFTPAHPPSVARSLVASASRALFLRQERKALLQARIVISNSERTKADLVTHVGVPPEHIRVVYYGVGPCFEPAHDGVRTQLRAALGWSDERRIAVFVGALGDRRKGFDTLFRAWARLCKDPGWHVDLKVIGVGRELPLWTARAHDAGLGDRISFLGFRADVRELLQAADVFIAPTRYEAYGLAVQEALCCGVPAIVSRNAGVAERMAAGLEALLLDDVESSDELVARLRAWHDQAEHYRGEALTQSAFLRNHTWKDMANQFTDAVL